MRRVNWSWTRRHSVVTGVVAALALGSWVTIGSAQSGTDASSQQPRRAQGAGPQTQDQTLAKQLEELRAQVARLQAELERQQQQPTSPAPGTTAAPAPGGMGQMGMRMGEMGRRMGMSEMGSMPPGGEMSMMDMHKGEMGMPPEGMRMPMGEMGGMGSSGAPAPATGGGMQMGGGASAGAQAGSGPTGSGTGGMRMGGPAARPGRSTSALPGNPGGSHLYHIGSTGFFLDQPQLTLTSEQQAALNQRAPRCHRRCALQPFTSGQSCPRHPCATSSACPCRARRSVVPPSARWRPHPRRG